MRWWGRVRGSGGGVSGSGLKTSFKNLEGDEKK